MAIDLSGVPLNAAGNPLGMIRVTPAVEFADPVWVEAATITSIQPTAMGTALTYGAARLVVRENSQVVLRMKYEANTVVGVVSNAEKPDRVRKK